MVRICLFWIAGTLETKIHYKEFYLLMKPHAAFGSVKDFHLAVGIPWRSKKDLVKLLLDSSWAAFAVGPKHLTPAAVKSSTIPKNTNTEFFFQITRWFVSHVVQIYRHINLLEQAFRSYKPYLYLPCICFTKWALHVFFTPTKIK